VAVLESLLTLAPVIAPQGPQWIWARRTRPTATAGAPGARRSVARAVGAQLTRPSRADRNKSLYALLFLSQGFEADRDWILETFRDELETVAEQSILSNVGDVARELLALGAGD
jgi:hypothetical protein